MKKGFTLIELLAVIVILALIALIATPLILGVIDSAKKGAAESSTYGYVEAIEQSDLLNQLGSNSTIREDGIYDLNTIAVSNYKGKSPSAVCVEIESGSVQSGQFLFDSYVVEYQSGVAKVNKDKTAIDCNTNALATFDGKKGVNRPQLANGMTPIKWVDGVETVTTADDPNWYDYSKQLWANSKTEDGSYFVWIPRYAYKITSGYHSSETGTIDVKFLKGDKDETVDGTSIETSGYQAGIKDTSMYYFTHPAFQTSATALGFWVAKFEPTAVEGVTSISGRGCNLEADDVTTKTVKIIPNATSWRCISINNAYTVVDNMKNKAEYGWDSSKVDTHLMKNTEWGAVAYLTKSNFGANTNPIWKNAYNLYQTGCSGSTEKSNYESNCIEYQTENGVKASTTWNITGVYDTSGGAWEFVASYVNNGNENLTTYGTSVVNAPSWKKDIYIVEETDLPENNYQANKTIYGDAIYETSTSGYDSNNAWNQTYGYMPATKTPFFIRGGSVASGGINAIFSFHQYGQGGWPIQYSFRPVVAILK